MNALTLTLLDLLTKGTAVLLLGYGCIAFMRQRSAAQRSLAWLAVFSAMLALPLAVWVQPVWTLNVPMVKQPVFLQTSTPPPVVKTGEISSPFSMPAPAAVTAPAWTLWQWLAASYVTGMVLVLAFRLIGSWQLRHLEKGTTRPDPRTQETVHRLQKHNGGRRRIRVLHSDRITVPMTWGTFRPVLMLPSACSAWTDAELHAALQHEFAHIRHLDAARRLLATLVSAFWWPHPLIWLGSKSWRLEQERACDDAVVRSGSDPTRYAAQLLDAARSVRLGTFQSAAALVMAMPSGLETRLRSVVGAGVNRSAAGRAAFFITAAASLCIITLCAVCQAQTETVTKSDGPMIYITAKFIEAPAADAAAKHPAMKKAMEGSPVILSDPELQSLIRQISQTQGVDLMSTPSVTTRSGQKATIQVAREFVHPTEFTEKNGHFVPITFEMMPIGVTVELTPTLQADGIIKITPATATVSESLGFQVYSRQHLKDTGKGVWVFDETQPPTGRPITEQREVKKGEVSRPQFAIEKWTGPMSLKPRESQLVCLKAGDSTRAKDTRRVWCFITAVEFKPAALQPTQATAPEKADNPSVTVLGEVQKQGRYDFKTGMTLNDLITLGQPYTDRDDFKVAMVTRGTGEAMRALNYRLPQEGTTPLIAGDTVLISTIDSIAPNQAVSPLIRRASQIILPRVQFQGVKLSEALDYLRVKSKELDPDKIGINILLREDPPNTAISLDLRDIPLLKVLRYVTELSGTHFTIEPYAITVSMVTAGGKGDEMLTRVYVVPSTLLGAEKSTKNWLAAKGISFPDGASAVFDPVTSRLTVKNTAPELHKVENVIENEKHGALTKTSEPLTPAIVRRARAIVIPRIDLSGATIDEAVEFLRVKAKQNDPKKKGVNIVLNKSKVKNDTQISLSLRDVPLWEALRYVSELAGMKVEASEAAIVIMPLGGE